MMSLSDDKQADVIDAFNTTSRYLDDILNINNVYFDNMVSQIYPSELQLNKANTSDTEAAFLNLHLSMINVTILILKLSISRFSMVIILALHPMESIYLNSFVLLEHLAMLLTSTLAINCYLRNFLNKAIRIINFKTPFLNLIDDLISKFQIGLKSLLRQGHSEPEFYGDLVYKLKKIVGSYNFSAQFIKIISHHKKIGYNINVLQQTACLVVNPIMVGNFAFLFNCTPVGRTSDSMTVPT